MSQQGIQVIDTTVQKTHEWISAVAELSHLDKNDAYKALRAVLQTLRDRLQVELAAHLSAQLPMLIRGLFFEGWEPSRVPKKMNHEEFFEAISEKIVSDRFIDPSRVTRDVFAAMGQFIAPGELAKVKGALPQDLRELWPELVGATT
ncbi:DUF2267 domain-containing protein [Verrucomicrobiota bacterium sgz303538]